MGSPANLFLLFSYNEFFNNILIRKVKIYLKIVQRMIFTIPAITYVI